MGLLRNVKLSIDDKSSMSVNSITLLLSALIGGLIGLVVCFVLIYDVTYDGKVDTDLSELAFFLLASGGYIVGSSFPKAYIDGKLKTRSWVENEKMEFDAQEELREYKERRKKESCEKEKEE